MKPHDQLPHDELGEGWTDCYQLASDPKSLEAPPVVKSGFGVFDDAQPFGGVVHGSINLWCGEMKVGKSRAVLALSAGYAVHGARVTYLMGEMSPEEQFERLLMMTLEMTTDELRDGEHADARRKAVAWLRDSVGERLVFRRVPITLGESTKAAEWVGAGGIVVVDSIQRVQLPGSNRQRSDEIETTMSHIVTQAEGTGAVFHLTSEIGKPPRGTEVSDFDLTKGSASPLQNSTSTYIVHKPEGTVQRIENTRRRRGIARDFSVILSERNGLPVIPMWEGGGA
jgi:hypothetical protein